jgi:hypothetical protein
MKNPAANSGVDVLTYNINAGYNSTKNTIASGGVKTRRTKRNGITRGLYEKGYYYYIGI